MDNAISVNGSFEIMPCENITDIDSRSGFQKLELTSSQKIQMGGLLQQLPAVVATDAVSNMYTVRFPDGIPKALTPLKQGGFSAMVKGENGRFVGTASLYPAEVQAIMLSTFNTMSIASGQYFLAQINNELKTMNQNIDKILEFLYGDKKAELISEVNFVKAAYQNYISIMEHDQQRLATIISIQEARKVAVKDIEFYISDLDSAVNTKGGDITALVDKMFQIKDCLELSIQLYCMSNVLEIYYSQNYDANYISNVENNSVMYIDKCEKRMLSCFSKLSIQIHTAKDNLLKKIDKPALEKRVESAVESLSRATESNMLKSLRLVAHASEAKAEYCLTGDGELYLKTA